jgi:hypothetical protein
VALILVTRHDPAKLVSMIVYGTGLVLDPLDGRSVGWRRWVGSSTSSEPPPFAFKKPRLWPHVIGHHKLLHIAVITASVTFYLIVVRYAVPFHRT